MENNLISLDYFTNFYFHFLPQFPARMIDGYRVCTNIDDCLLDLPLNNRLAVATPLKHATNNRFVPNRKIYCFSEAEHIYSYPVPIFMHPDHPLLPQVNRIIQKSLEGGLFVKWNRDGGSDINRSSANDHPNGPIVLSLEHIFTGVALSATFGLFAIGAFIAELIVHPIARRRNCARIWKWIDILIDGDRHFLLSLNRKRNLCKTVKRRRQMTPNLAN